MGSRGARGMRGFGVAAAVAATLVLGLPAIASADTFTVNDDDAPGDVGPGGTCGPRDHATINDAVAVAADDDTIRVCAGTYDESVETELGVTFLGAQAGVDARTRSVPIAEESAVATDAADGAFDLDPSEGTTVDGFAISNGDGPGIRPGIETTIVNNEFSGNDVGVIGDGFGATIRHNHFGDLTVDGSDNAIALDEADQATVDDNLFDGANTNIAIIMGFDGDAGGGIAVTDNESNGAGGIALFGGTDAQIARNTITSPPQSEAPGIFLAASVDVDITRNLVDNPAEGGAGIVLVNFLDSNQFVDITRNTLLGDGDEAGILLTQFATGEGDLDVHFNRIAGNDVGLFAEDGNLVDARNNWWGCNEGPEGEDCDAVDFIPDAFVDFDPWLTLSAAADPDSIGAGGQTSQITADVLTNSDGEAVEPDFPDGAQVDFATDLGTVDPLFDLTEGAVATTTLTSGAETGTANVDSTLDAETVTTPVEITEETNPPLCAERIDGTAQNDNLTGTEGSELIRGRAGRDKVDGLGGDDCVKGGSGPDKVKGGAGEDRARGGAGDDVVKARDGESDVVRCGAGDDVAKVNPGDNVRGCEEVKRG